MNRWLRLGIPAASAAGLLLLGAVALGPVLGPSVYTDGAAITVPAGEAAVRTVLWKPAEPIPSALNTPADEYEPRISADGLRMVFVRGRAGANADLYQSTWTTAGWSEPAPLAALNSPGDELGPELSADGRSLYFYADRPGGLGGFDLWVSRADDAGSWGEPVNLGPSVNSPFNEYGPALTPVGDALYFSSNRPRAGEPPAEPEGWPATVREVRGRHDYDLYRAGLSESGPGTAAALSDLNTTADEGAPALSPVGDFLYFASDRPGGLGGFDLYRTRLAAKPPAPADVPTAAHGPVEPAGPAINSRFNDLDPALSADGFRLTFSSDRPSDPAAGGSPADYGLWHSSSREVYRERDTEAGRLALARAWERLWPWLLLLISSLAAALLLARFARRAGWARGGQLGLLARCLIFSFAVHLVIASLLAVWKVGSTIGDFIREGGGAGRGHRVMLSSSGMTSGADAIGRQIRANLGDLPGLEPVMSVDARAETPQHHIAAGRADLAPQITTPTLDRAPAAPELAASAAPEPSSAVDRPEIPARPLDAALPREIAAAPASAEPAATAPSPAPAPAARAQIPSALPNLSAPVVIEAGPGPIVDRATLPPSELTPSEAPASPHIAAAGPSVPPAATEPPAVALPAEVAAHAARGTEPSIDTASRAGPPIAAAPRAVLPTAPPLNGGGAARLEPGPSAASTRVDAAPAPASIAAGPAPDSRPAPLGTASPSLAPPALGDGLSLPAEIASGGNQTSASSAEAEEPRGLSVPALSLGRAGLPPAPMLGLDDGPSSRPGLEPGPASTMRDSTPRLGFGLPDAPTAADPTGPGRPIAPGPSLASVPGGAGGDDLRLPEVPAEDVPPTPVETFAQRDPDPEVRGEILEKMGGSRETERAVTLALRWLAAHQEPDGRWSGQGFDDGCGRCDGEAEIDSDAAITGIALLCYLGAGHTHQSDGEHRETVARALRWLVNREAGRGDLRRGETMYAQTVATVALCEALSMTRDPALAGPARRAVNFIMQTSARGVRSAADTSVLGWQVMAVESARRAGIEVSGATYASAERYLDRAADRTNPGHYAYSPGSAASPAMTAEAMFVRQLTGHTRDERRMQQSAEFILGTPPRWKAGAPTYYWYYATLALFQQQGDAWTHWNEALIPELLGNQRQDGPAAGSWDPQDEWSRLGGRIYQTAVCTLSLEVYYRYRPAGMKESASAPVKEQPPALGPGAR